MLIIDGFGGTGNYGYSENWYGFLRSYLRVQPGAQ